MTDFVSRPYAGEADLPLLIEFARRATIARAPGDTYLHPGDVVWQLYPATGAAWFENIELWFDAAGLAGYALFEPPLSAQFDLRPGIGYGGEPFAAMLAWAEQRRGAAPAVQIPKAYAMLGDTTLATICLESDLERIAALESHGFEQTERHNVRYRRDLAGPVVVPPLPPGYTVRHATDADVEERAELHRDAWSVWGNSTFSAGRYRRLRAAPVYDEQLDIVVEAPDGQLVSYCISWQDRASGIATFEPVGTRPAYTGRGLARAAIHEALVRLQQRGMRTALIGTASVNAPALALYPSCGFAFVEKESYWVKQMG